MSSKKSRKLWKDIGTTKEKYDRDSQRSPSFDRSSLARSNQGRSQSSHSVRLNKRKQQYQKAQIRNQLEQAMKIYITNDLHELGVNLMEVPEQEDVHNSHISFKNDTEDQNLGEDHVQLHLLNELFNKSSKTKKVTKLKKQDVPVLKQSVKNLSIYQLQVSKYVKFSLNNFKNEIFKMDRKLKEIISKMTKQLFLKTNQIAKLTLQNNELKKQLMSAFDMIEELQNINCANVTSSKLLLKSRRSLNAIESFDFIHGKQQDDDRTVKLSHHRNNQHDSMIDHISQYKYKSNGFSQIKQTKMKTSDNIAEVNALKRRQQGENSQLSKREKFKKFINQRHHKKNEIKKEFQRQSKFDSLTDNGITSVKYYKNTGTIINNQPDIKKLKQDKNPFSLQMSGQIQEKFCKNNLEGSSQTQKKIERLNSQKVIYPIARSKKGR